MSMVATVQLVEGVGPPPSQEKASDYLHILGLDAFSFQDPRGYRYAPIIGEHHGGPVNSMERWFRFRFEPPFTEVSDFHFWTPDLVIPEGWTLLWGTAIEYQQPSNAASAIATGSLPTTRPDNPNVGGDEPLDGTETRYSLWIVLQASVNADASVGPMRGFDAEGEPVGVDYRLDWTEL